MQNGSHNFGKDIINFIFLLEIGLHSNVQYIGLLLFCLIVILERSLYLFCGSIGK